MTCNLDNALHGLQDSRAALFCETGNPSNTDEQEQLLEDIQLKLNEVEEMIKTYGN